MRNRCARLGCRSYAIWTDVDTGAEFCGAHAVLYMDDDETPQKRADFADEYARDAEREARSL